MYESWIEAERFYTLFMPWTIIGLAVLVFVYIFIYSYTAKGQKLRKGINLSVISILLLSLLYFVFGHLRYSFWVEQNEYIHPGIREYTYILGIRSDEDRQVIRAQRQSPSLYRQLNALEKYEADARVQPMIYDYLGSRDDTHYFSFGDEDQYAFRIRGTVEWTQGEREVHGWQFRLTDDRFETLGFAKDFDIIFDVLLLPETEQRELADLSDYRMTAISEVYPNWIFPNQRD